MSNGGLLVATSGFLKEIVRKFHNISMPFSYNCNNWCLTQVWFLKYILHHCPSLRSEFLAYFRFLTWFSNFQDPDAILVNGQVSPNSAMSISPATSEVYSILDNSDKISLTHHHNNLNSTTATPQKKSSKSKTNRSHHRVSQNNHVERADLDFDWRGVKANGNSGNSPTPSGSGQAVTQRQLSADEDQNWRDHKPLQESNTAWKTAKSKNRKIQGN